MLVDAFLRHAKVYDLFQHVVGGYRARRHYVDQHIRPRPGMKVLDIGCGTGELLEMFPTDTLYVGLDPSPEYVRAARQRFGERGTFLDSGEEETAIPHWGAFDVVHLTGVLHHVDDREAHRLLGTSRAAMHESGRFFTLDGCLMDSNNWIERTMLRLDRGKFMRTEQGYAALACPFYSTVVCRTYRRLFFPLPYPCVVMECSP